MGNSLGVWFREWFYGKEVRILMCGKYILMIRASLAWPDPHVKRTRLNQRLERGRVFLRFRGYETETVTVRP